MRVPFRRFVVRTGGRRLAPHRAKRDFIGECFPQGRSGRSCVRLVSVLRRAYKLLPFDLWEKIDVQIADRMSVETKITLGVDTHKDTHVAVALDGLGRHLGTLSVPTNTAGYRELLGWARELGIIEQVGVEGTGSFGAGLARLLKAEGIPTREVIRPKRHDQYRSGKSFSYRCRGSGPRSPGRYRNRQAQGRRRPGGDDPRPARHSPLGGKGPYPGS